MIDPLKQTPISELDRDNKLNKIERRTVIIDYEYILSLERRIAELERQVARTITHW